MNQTTLYANTIVDLYAQYDRSEGQYTLSVSDLPDSVKSEFASIIISNSNSIAGESCGADNDSFERKMLPALINLLKAPQDSDKEYDFIESWKTGIVEYCKNEMQSLIDAELIDKNYDSVAYQNDVRMFNSINSKIQGIPAWMR